jgi:hypothetical protein
MKTSLRTLLAAGCALPLLASGFTAAAQTAAKATLALSPAKPTSGVTAAIAKSGKAASLARVTESLDSQLMDRLNATRKFTLVARSDLDALLKEQELAGSGNVAKSDDAAKAGQITGAKFLLVTTVDDFDDNTEKVEMTTLNRVAFVRRVRFGGTARIYDSSTGGLLESVVVRLEETDNRVDQAGFQRSGEPTDTLLLTLAGKVAEQVASRVADAAFPVRVLVKRDKQITLNRGEGAGVSVGQLWNVFATGEKLVDPDTGEVLGMEEVLVGRARIVSVQPKFSTAEILDDTGIDKGAVMRPAPAPDGH